MKYESVPSSYEYEKQQKEAGNEFLYKFTSARRSIGFGGSSLREHEEAMEGVVEIGRETFKEEVKAKGWVEVVGEFFVKEIR